MADRLDFTGFRPASAEKVIRLLDVLNAIGTDPFPKVAPLPAWWHCRFSGE